MKLIYTNRGILTEERLREMKECGETMEECGEAGALDDMHPMRMAAGYHEMPLGSEMDRPSKIVVIRKLDEAGDEGTPSHSGNQGALEVGPQGTAGSAASGNPGGANVPDPMEKRGEPRVVISPSNDLKEAFNRRAEALLEAWMEESIFEDSVYEELHGDQDELDVAPPYGKLTGADFKNLGKKSAHKAGHKEKD